MPGDPIETTIDCFGRDKHRSDRDDMGGIGSFERRCQTLYIGNIAITDHMEDIVRAHFSEWGEIEHGREDYYFEYFCIFHFRHVYFIYNHEIHTYTLNSQRAS